MAQILSETGTRGYRVDTMHRCDYLVYSFNE
jgi:hypothetical protein